MAQTLSQSFGGKSNSQKYMLMSSQEEVLRRRLSLHIPSAAPMTASSPEMQSLSTSPTYSRPFYSSTWTPTLGYTSTSPIPIHPGTIYEHHDAQDEDSNNMSDVNQRIKATLTELLNTESVRSDEKYRAWIQERLMDAERKIRQQRRRRSSTVNGEELATSIASHIDYHVAPCKSWT